MKDVTKKVKIDVVISAVLCAILGVVLLVWPEETIQLVCKVLAAGLIVLGAVNIITFLRNKELHPLAGPLGLVVLLIGAWIFLKPESVASMVPIVIGVILVVHGVQDFGLAFETKNNGYEKWWSVLIMGVISLVFGVLCIVHAFGLVAFAMKLIGVALIYDGISDLWIVIQRAKAMKNKEAENAALEVEYQEVVDEEQGEE